jgi:hypothetical protein
VTWREGWNPGRFILYSVNLRPVVIAMGGIPSFRAMSVSTSEADETQPRPRS